MAEIRIPEEYERGFLEIRELSEGQIEELITVLDNTPPVLNSENLQSRVVSVTESIDSEDLEPIVETLVSLYALRDAMNLEVPEFADIICDAVDASGVGGLEFANDEERAFFEARLIRLLGVNSLDVAARAADLLYEHEHTIHGTARVLSDIRPIFGVDPEAPPRGGVVVHTLKISYHEGRQIKELFVALDSVQVDELIGVLGRASLKGESLRRMLEAANVPHVEVD